MSKAEELASKEWSDLGFCNNEQSNAFKLGYLKGYRQAEKDLELTWKDMMLIHRYIKDAMNYHLYKIMEGAEGQKVVYQEVLKRFKEQRT